ncbi:MAG: site-2 protease family protein [Paludisphaera borealis]|uniref:site-2 protease family protein n=1 Tax=Paludisphaera borealis TaxID=1387353 RepID=UPI0028440039|nr:site-2 protease family protein [Paludisphaera borealis]MDR3620894.1 site-2 protease family protein [Paludisphaera borealis]
MRMSWKLGRAAGIDVFLHPTFLLILFVPDAVANLPLVIALFGCVLLHEFGHALTARRFGIGTVNITLYPIGGVARLMRMPRAPGAELLIALAGPAVNFAIAAGLYTVLGLGGSAILGDYASFFLLQLMAMNLVLGGFNLIPAFPMDGGRVLRAVLSGWIGRGRATSFAASVGRALALGFGIYSLLTFNLIQVALAGFIYYAAGVEEAGVLADERRRRSPTPNEEDLWKAPPGYRWIESGQGVWRLAPVTVADWANRRWG